MPRGVYQGDKQICRNAKGLTSNSTAIDPGIFLYCKYLSDEIFVHDYRAKLHSREPSQVTREPRHQGKFEFRDQKSRRGKAEPNRVVSFQEASN